jgi:phosphatidate cytidylyltransferase
MGRALDKVLKSNMFIRVASAFVLLPLFYWIVKTGDMAYAALLLLGALWAGYEWLMMINRPQQKAVWVVVFFVIALTWGVALQPDTRTALALTLSSSLVMMLGFRLFKVPRPVLLSMALSYLAPAMVGLMALRDLPHGFSLTALLCASVWMTDTGAYFFGKFLRGARLAPDISPSKTWAGFIGGLVTALATAGMCVWIFKPANPAIVYMVVLGLSLASQCGDLFESWVKRQAGVKNSGDLIPGHGGLLDRIDGLLMAVLMFWIGLWFADFDLSWWLK